MKQYVVCGDSRQYFDYLRRNNKDPRTHVYLHDAQQLLGLSEVHGVFVGSYRERPDIEEIIRAIRWINRIPSGQYIIPPTPNYERKHPISWTPHV
jgi:hypothetical protein